MKHLSYQTLKESGYNGYLLEHGVRLEDKGLIGIRNNKEYTIQDNRKVLEFYYEHRNDNVADLTHEVMSNLDFWGQDLTNIPGFEQAVSDYLEKIQTKGVYGVMKDLL